MGEDHYSIRWNILVESSIEEVKIWKSRATNKYIYIYIYGAGAG